MSNTHLLEEASIGVNIKWCCQNDQKEEHTKYVAGKNLKIFVKNHNLLNRRSQRCESSKKLIWDIFWKSNTHLFVNY